jgi:hypothetical protein
LAAYLRNPSCSYLSIVFPATLIWLLHSNAMHFDSFTLGARHLFQTLVLFFYVKLYIVVFRIKISIRITKKKYEILFEKKYFDSLVLKPLELYVNLLSRFVAY